MVYSLAYRRPAFVSLKSSFSSFKGSLAAGSFSSDISSTPPGIPQALSFDRVISGGTCPPCTTRDFMNYLIYIEHAAENLQFFIWLKSYSERFQLLPDREKELSPEIVFKEVDTPRGLPLKPRDASSETPEAFEGTDFTPVNMCEKLSNPFDDDRLSEARSGSGWEDDASTLRSGKKIDYHKAASDAFGSADVRLQPFTIQPFREEITRIIATYIADGAPRQLNLAAKERIELLQSLAFTTHPSAFRKVCRTVEWSLRRQAHPNFVRWSICNGNKPRVIFAQGLGTSGVVGGILISTLLTLSHNDRAWRLLAAFPFFIGTATLFAAFKGMCVVLHGLHHRHLRPWELFAEADEVGSAYDLKNDSLDSFGSKNSYEDEPWIARYERRNLIRKVFDREIWIQEPALRQIQDTIFLQAMLLALLVTAIAIGAFCAIPVGSKI